MSFVFVQVNALQAQRQAATRATRWDGTPRRPTFSKGEGSEERATRTRAARSRRAALRPVPETGLDR